MVGLKQVSCRIVEFDRTMFRFLFKRKRYDKELSSILSTLQLMTKFATTRTENLRTGDAPRKAETRSRAEREAVSGGVRDHKRYPFKAIVTIEGLETKVVGAAYNISASGLFVKTKEALFELDERVKVFIQPVGSNRSYQAIASVIRYADTRPKGYGLRFSTF
jgi:hypothetical protein